MDVEDIIIKHLKDNGFDGLSGRECGCLLGHLWPCGTIHWTVSQATEHPHHQKKTAIFSSSRRGAMTHPQHQNRS